MDGSLNAPHPAEMITEEDIAEAQRLLEEPRDIPTDRILKMLSGEEEMGLFSEEDLMEQMLRRQFDADGPTDQVLRPTAYLFIICFVIILLIFAYFGWNLYKYLIDKERKREEKKKMKQKKKK